jgi:hypothetical protein
LDFNYDRIHTGQQQKPTGVLLSRGVEKCEHHARLNDAKIARNGTCMKNEKLEAGLQENPSTFIEIDAIA